MGKRLVSLLTLLAVLTSVSGQNIKGSDTMLPVSQKVAEVFMNLFPNETVTVTGGGSGIGIVALLDGTADLAQSSRKIKFTEKQKIQGEGKEVVEVVAGYDALAVIVHPSNKVSKLTRKQLEDIFTGKIKNWKEVGGEDRRIIPYARETSSGTYEFFREKALSRKNYMSGIMNMPTTGAVIQSISQTKGAIGYVGLAYVNSKVKALELSWDEGQTYVKALLSETRYPIKRPLYYYYLRESEHKVINFIKYMLSEEGQKIVSEIGFIPVE